MNTIVYNCAFQICLSKKKQTVDTELTPGFCPTAHSQMQEEVPRSVWPHNLDRSRVANTFPIQ